jgi:hypothetical protein
LAFWIAFLFLTVVHAPPAASAYDFGLFERLSRVADIRRASATFCALFVAATEAEGDGSTSRVEGDLLRGALDLAPRFPLALVFKAEKCCEDEAAALALRAWERARLSDRDAASDLRDPTNGATLAEEEGFFVDLDPRDEEAAALALQAWARLRLSVRDASNDVRDATDDATLDAEEGFFFDLGTRDEEAAVNVRGCDQAESPLPQG